MDRINRFQNNPLYPLLDTDLSKRDDLGNDWKNKEWIKRDLSEEQLASLQSQRIRNIVIEKKIGSGAQGVVHKILADFDMNIETGEEPEWKQMRFAMKVTHHEYRLQIQRNLDEIRILCGLRHENIGNMIEFFGIPDSETGFPFSKVCIILELCDNSFTSLRASNPELQHYGRLPENLSRHWFAQIARGLYYLHSNGIVHDDIHKNNILYRQTDIVMKPALYEDIFLACTFKIVDFGLSRRVTDELAFKNDITELIDVLGQTVEKPVPAPLKSLLATPFGRISEILGHSWLQTNDEPRTEPYIFRQDSTFGERQSTMPFIEWSAPSQSTEAPQYDYPGPTFLAQISGASGSGIGRGQSFFSQSVESQPKVQPQRAKPIPEPSSTDQDESDDDRTRFEE